jgi:SAM-dependent methyltransferase
MANNIDKFNKAAELYFRNHPDKSHFEKKPFHNMDETPSILLRLGIILQNLYVGPSHKVVDFGSGTCWLSLILNKLKISTFSVDVSASALAIGKNIFERDPYANLDVEHHFIEFDGYHINIPDASIDRIICFDSYHHLPNTKTILHEFFRILVPGGIVAFAEPGEEHSQSLQSIHEKNNFGILENDVYIDKIWQEAQECGFTDFKIFPIGSASGMAIDFNQYEKYMEGCDRIFPHDKNRFHLRGGQVFFLHKGFLALDSRAPNRLLATIESQGAVPNKVTKGGVCSLIIKITNKSDCIWISHHYPLGGFVQLGAHIEKHINSPHNFFYQDDSYVMINYDYLRVPLPSDIKPNEFFILEPSFTLPHDPGIYRITFDLVDELVRWFAQDGSQTLSFEIEVH